MIILNAKERSVLLGYDWGELGVEVGVFASGGAGAANAGVWGITRAWKCVSSTAGTGWRLQFSSWGCRRWERADFCENENQRHGAGIAGLRARKQFVSDVGTALKASELKSP